jgi:hypothetical protein
MSIVNSNAPDADDAEDADVPQLAVQALNVATQRALDAGQTVVLVRGDKLVQITNGEIIELETLAPRKKIDFAANTERT